VNGTGFAWLSLSLVLASGAESAAPADLRAVVAGLSSQALGDKEFQQLVQQAGRAHLRRLLENDLRWSCAAGLVQ
jgi:hypothetical protein